MSKPGTAVLERTTTTKKKIGIKGRWTKKVTLPRAADFQLTVLTAPHFDTVKTIQKTLMAPLYINASDYLKNKYVWDGDGEKIYPMVREGLTQGRKVILSVKGLRVNGGFWDTAYCKAYGEFPQDVVEQNIEVVDIDDVDLIDLEGAKDIRKLYYYDRETYDEIVNNVDPIIGYDEPMSDDFVFIGTDKHAPYDSSSFYYRNRKVEEEGK
jgi:hypothetical protein